MAKYNVYRIKVTLKHSKPPIWRRIEVPGNITLARLHRILQETMGWEDYHLHQFAVGKTYYGIKHPDEEIWESETLDESGVSLMRLAPAEKFKFVYEYDFGDGWEHTLLVEKILPPEEGVRYPRCVAGKLACPPEDVGGMWGYYEFLQSITDPKHPRHDELLEWIGGHFDPDEFDLDDINKRLKRL
ncbi:MAG: plasmid pRiA4b ORF-3 family protein [FCB group bacterium]|jgi:hypothetical protein|nr:plasmid pRiA4b ORF-3 family protein [FCB group bacterium]